MKEARYSPLTIARFWSKVDIPRTERDCWEWMGAAHGKGYGLFNANGKLQRAHRIAWELINEQKFPEGMHACHHCDNPKCVNPDHIFVGTHADNMADMRAKGRARGPFSPPPEPRLDL